MAQAEGHERKHPDVLLYLFEHYFTNDAFDHPGDDLTAQNGPLVGELTEAGFRSRKPQGLRLAGRAGAPAAALGNRGWAARPASSTARSWPSSTSRRGFLLFLEQHGILDADQRELVLDRAMALDQEELELDDLKWVVLMVLFNQPGSEAAYAWMETQMFPGRAGTGALTGPRRVAA